MVSILPNSQLYNLTYKFDKSLCSKPAHKEVNNGTIYDVLKNDRKFSKIVELIDKGELKYMFKAITNHYGTQAGGLTLFVTDDAHIPDVFVKSADKFRAEVFIRSYTFSGIADIKYLVDNGTTIYKTRNDVNPILCNVKQHDDKQVEVTINRVGRVVSEIKTTNGIIITMDNIADVAYVN